MSKINCLCGVQLSDIMQPNHHEGRWISSIDADKLEEDPYHQKLSQFWECYECGNVILCTDGHSLRHYKPENGSGAIGLFKATD